MFSLSPLDLFRSTIALCFLDVLMTDCLYSPGYFRNLRLLMPFFIGLVEKNVIFFEERPLSE